MIALAACDAKCKFVFFNCRWTGSTNDAFAIRQCKGGRILMGTSLEEFTALLGKLEAKGLGGFLNGWVTADASDPTTNIAYIYQGGISLPDEAYYREETHSEVRTKLVAHIEKMFDLAGISGGASHASRIMELETEIASYHWDTVRSRDAVLTFNKKTFAEITALAAPFDWHLWADNAGIPRSVLDSVVIAQPDFIENMGKVFAKFEVEKWRSWLTWHLISSAAPYLSSPFVNENFAFLSNFKIISFTLDFMADSVVISALPALALIILISVSNFRLTSPLPDNKRFNKVLDLLNCLICPFANFLDKYNIFSLV